jgi:hypothetical protein
VYHQPVERVSACRSVWYRNSRVCEFEGILHVFLGSTVQREYGNFIALTMCPTLRETHSLPLRVAACVTDDTARWIYASRFPWVYLSYPVLWFFEKRASSRPLYTLIMTSDGLARQNLVVGISTALTALSCKAIYNTHSLCLCNTD